MYEFCRFSIGLFERIRGDMYIYIRTVPTNSQSDYVRKRHSGIKYVTYTNIRFTPQWTVYLSEFVHLSLCKDI